MIFSCSSGSPRWQKAPHAKNAWLGKNHNLVGIEHRPNELDDRRFINHRKGDTV